MHRSPSFRSTQKTTDIYLGSATKSLQNTAFHTRKAICSEQHRAHTPIGKLVIPLACKWFVLFQAKSTLRKGQGHKDWQRGDCPHRKQIL
jgi:hypothetical protein